VRSAERSAAAEAFTASGTPIGLHLNGRLKDRCSGRQGGASLKPIASPMRGGQASQGKGELNCAPTVVAFIDSSGRGCDVRRHRNAAHGSQ
jgi:hypothetical protein